LGGLYFIVNAILSQIACFVSAALYSAYADVDTEGSFHPGSNSSIDNSSALSTNTTWNANPISTRADFAGPNSNKIDDVSLFVSFVTLGTVWTLALVGLLLTVKREYLGSFVSLQTGCEYSRSYFLDNEADDSKRINIFYMNERHWQSIRALVRGWVHRMYSIWKQLAPAWFTVEVQARIPDDCMPPKEVEALNLSAPGGRRQTLNGMGLIRRMSFALQAGEAEAILVPAPALVVGDAEPN
jgi:hypothetical protein